MRFNTWLDDDILLTSVYDYLWHQLGLKFAGSYRHITAEKPDHYDKDYLACKDDDPILQVEQVVYLEMGDRLNTLVVEIVSILEVIHYWMLRTFN